MPRDDRRDRDGGVAGAAAGELLRRLLAGERPADVNVAVDGADLVGALAFHKVGLVLRQELLGLFELDERVKLHLRHLRLGQAALDLKLRADLVLVARALDAAEVSWAVIKGPVVTENLYDGSGRREYGDLDVLVDAASLERALTALAAQGARLLDRNWPFLRRHGQAELTLFLPHGTALDLHWHVLNTPGLRSAFAIPIADVLARGRTMEVLGTHVPALSEVDQLLHLALHAALSGGDRLLWLSDLLRACNAEPDWDLVARTARTWRVQLVLAVMLQRVKLTLGGTMGYRDPSATPGAKVWQGLDRRLLRVLPVAQAHLPRRSGRSGSSVPMATRSTAAQSFRALLVAQLRHHLPSPSAELLRDQLHADVPNAHARRAYLLEAARSSAVGSAWNPDGPL